MSNERGLNIIVRQIKQLGDYVSRVCEIFELKNLGT